MSKREDICEFVYIRTNRKLHSCHIGLFMRLFMGNYRFLSTRGKDVAEKC